MNKLKGDLLKSENIELAHQAYEKSLTYSRFASDEYSVKEIEKRLEVPEKLKAST